MVGVTVSRQGKTDVELDWPTKSLDMITVGDLKAKITAHAPQLVANRQRLTLLTADGKIPLIDAKRSLASYGVPEGGTLRLKDLGRQVTYRALYLWEYIGPIFIIPLFLRFSPLVWGDYQSSRLQIFFRNYTVLHFAKRWLESAFIHHFSRATLPLSYVLRKSVVVLYSVAWLTFLSMAYYWGMCGLLIGLTLYRPAYSAQALRGSILDNPAYLHFWTIWILINEILNVNTHLHLRSLKVEPGQPRKYPTGFGFGTAVCANYWFETLHLIGLLAVTGADFGVVAYICVAVYFMYRWSGQKYRRYRKEFDPKVFPAKRWKMFPPLY